MPYVERVTRAGKTIEVERYFTSRYKKPGIKRGDKVKPTKEEQKKVNTRAAERKLRLLLNANFGYGDYHLELDYMPMQQRMATIINGAVSSVISSRFSLIFFSPYVGMLVIKPFFIYTFP